MSWFSLSPTGWTRVCVLTVVGTAICVVVALAIDSYSLQTGGWRLGERWTNNLLIPLIVAPPFFLFLLTKLRELSIAHAELTTLAATDQLTNCLNRRAFLAVVEGYLARMAVRPDLARGALLVLDVDHFKKINDTFGHHGGDVALKLIAESIRASVREHDLVARLGGEEFGVFLPGADPTRTEVVAERIRSAVAAAEFPDSARRYQLSLSIGGSAYDAPPVTFSELFQDADSLLYQAKQAGRDRAFIGRFNSRPSSAYTLDLAS